MLWHLLSLDAPAVATLWTWFAARVAGVALAPAVPITMFVAVWCLYAADRLLDARLLDARRLNRSTRELEATDNLEARHRFHHAHRVGFALALLLAASALVPLLLTLSRGLLLAYLPLGLVTAAWFGVVHLRAGAGRLPKELAVALVFAAAVFLPALVEAPHLRPRLVLAAVLFAALLSMNGLFIFRWEHPGQHHADGFSQRLLGFIRPLTLGLAVVALLSGGLVGVALALAAAGLLLLDHARARLDQLLLRTAVDLVLLTPLLLLPALR